jgi:hypothetical protein
MLLKLACLVSEEQLRDLRDQAIEETLGISRKRGLPTSDYLEAKQRKRLRVAGLGQSPTDRAFWLQMHPTAGHDAPIAIPHGCELEISMYSSFKNTIRELRRVGTPADSFIYVSPLQSASKSDVVEVPSWQQQVHRSCQVRVEYPYRVGGDRGVKKMKRDHAATMAPAALQQKRRVLEAAPAPNNALVNKKGNRLEHDKVVHAPFPLAGTFLQYSHKPLRVLPPPSTKTKREFSLLFAPS